MGDGNDEREQEREQENERKKRFRVVDRRRFTAEGDERPDVEKRDERPPAPAEPPKAAAPSPEQKRQERREQKAAKKGERGPVGSGDDGAGAGPAGQKAGAEEEEESPIPFAAFLQSMAQQVLMQLGMIPFPSGTRQLDLEGARDTIDVLTMLRVKTRGNLTEDEDRAFEQILYELRMTYLDVANRVAAAGPGGPGAGGGPGPAGPGGVPGGM